MHVGRLLSLPRFCSRLPREGADGHHHRMTKPTASFRLRTTHLPLLVLAASLTASSSGCGTSGADVCEAVCDCEGCSEKQLDECIDEIEEIEEKAEELGCEDQLDDWLSCVDDELECRGDDADVDGCDEEEDALTRCGQGTAGTGSACDQVVALCGTSSGFTECSGVNECIASCVVAAGNCDSSTVNDCGNGCIEE
jgi:hypothetical protein